MSGKRETSPLLSIRNPLNKIRQYISTLEITRGFFIALLASIYLYMEYWDHTSHLLNTFSALLSLYLLLQSNRKVWFFTGFFIAVFWFWWISLSFIHYNMPWAIPLVILATGVVYAVLFWIIASIAEKTSTPVNLIIKALGLLLLSYIHPFGFDWFKPELIFIHSYLGIGKWQFAIILAAISLSLWKQQLLYLFLVIFAYQPSITVIQTAPKQLELVTLHTPVQEKWNKRLHNAQFKEVFHLIDAAIKAKKSLIIFPESVFPIFLNYDQALISKLEDRAKKINIVVGGLYWDEKTPRNSTYIFTKEKTIIANKVLLVPFGESNPLPDFLSDWVNKVFYDGAVDYKASKNVVDYDINGTIYRNAICFEATSEKLYEKDKEGKRPKHMIVLSNNGWFTPSIEPTLQRLLLQYYSKKYGTTIYHSVNMSDSYIIQNGVLGK